MRPFRSSIFSLVAWINVFLLYAKTAEATKDARRLYDDLFSSYNKLLRPVINQSEPVKVRLGMKLSQLIEVCVLYDMRFLNHLRQNEVRQVVVMNVFMQLLWQDPKLTWDPDEYNGVNRLYIPSSRLWIPDIILYNNAEGNFEIAEDTKAQISPDGYIYWTPPAIYRYYCAMDITFFPYDEQFCHLKFSGWSHDGLQLEVDTVSKPDINGTKDDKFIYKVLLATDLREYTPSASWDITAIPAEKHVLRYHCCPDVPYPDITFYFKLRRKRLFFTTTLIVPCVCISLLTLPLYYLPSGDAKVTLCITILVALTVFVLLLAELIPPSSVAIPLIGKYLLFTMTMVTMSIFMTILVLSITYSCPHTFSEVPAWVRRIFIDRLPRMLVMKRSSVRPHRASILSQSSALSSIASAANKLQQYQNQVDSTAAVVNGKRSPKRTARQVSAGNVDAGAAAKVVPIFTGYNTYARRNNVLASRHQLPGPHRQSPDRDSPLSDLDRFPKAVPEDTGNAYEYAATPLLFPQAAEPSELIQQVCDNVQSIRSNFQRREAGEAYKRDWKFVGMVIDRLLLWVFATITIAGTLLIIFWAPSLYDTSPALPRNCRGVTVNNTDDVPYDCMKRHVTVCIENKCYNEMTPDMARELDEAESMF